MISKKYIYCVLGSVSVLDLWLLGLILLMEGPVPPTGIYLSFTASSIIGVFIGSMIHGYNLSEGNYD